MNSECRLSYFPGGLAPSCSFWETALAASRAQLTPQKLANIVFIGVADENSHAGRKLQFKRCISCFTGSLPFWFFFAKCPAK